MHSHPAADASSTPSSEACCQGSGCCGGKNAAAGAPAKAAGGCCKDAGEHAHSHDHAQHDHTDEIVSAMDAPKPQKETFLALEPHALIARYRRGIENFDRRIFFLDEQQLDIAFLPDSGVGRWPIRVLVGHLADAEIATIHRVRRAVAEDHPVVALWDENAFIDAGVYGRASAAVDAAGNAPAPIASSAFPLAGFVAVIHTLRRWMSEWLMTLTPAQWERSVMHPQRGEVTVRQMVSYDVWHLEHHGWYLNAKVEKLLGVDIPESALAGSANPAGGGGGGCGSGCGCKG